MEHQPGTSLIRFNKVKRVYSLTLYFGWINSAWSLLFKRMNIYGFPELPVFFILKCESLKSVLKIYSIHFLHCICLQCCKTSSEAEYTTINANHSVSRLGKIILHLCIASIVVCVYTIHWTESTDA